MPEIKVKHVVSFSSEDKVHKAENLTKPETYRKWKCATPGEKSANVVLQFKKATQIYSIDIGNESSAFVEVLVGRSSDVVSNFQVLLVASSFMSPLESRNGTHGNRVRMFGPEKLSQNVKEEKWDCVQIVCTQPFNKTITYGLTFVKFHSPPEKIEESPRATQTGKATAKIGPFRIKYEDDEEDDSPPIGSWFGKKKDESSGNSNSPTDSPSYATAVLASKENPAKASPQNNMPKRKINENSNEPPAKKPATSTLNKDHIVYKDVLDHGTDSKNTRSKKEDAAKISENSKVVENKRSAKTISNLDKPSASGKQANVKKKIPFNKLMEKVVIVLSGFVNPLRSQLRDKALDMGAKYKADWDSTCTHLICAFLNTPKYAQVSKLKGKIVSKDWIIDCYKKRELLPWKKYILRQSDDSSEESEAQFTEESEDDSDFSEELDESEEEELLVSKKKKTTKKKNSDKKTENKARTATHQKNKVPSPKADNTKKKDVLATPPNKKSVFDILNPTKVASDNSGSPSVSAPSGSRDDSETEDEDALADYMAKTDVDSDSGANTEDEIRKVENKAKKSKKETPTKGLNGIQSETELAEKPDVTDLPLPQLLNIFKQKHFFLYGDFNASKSHDLQRYIIAYNGVLEDYMSDKIKYVITEKKWDKDFDDALSENEDLIFVKPAWIYKCHKAGKLIPYQPYIIIPDS